MYDALPLHGGGTSDEGFGLLGLTGRKGDDIATLKGKGELFAFGGPRNYGADTQQESDQEKWAIRTACRKALGCPSTAPSGDRLHGGHINDLHQLAIRTAVRFAQKSYKFWDITWVCIHLADGGRTWRSW